MPLRIRTLLSLLAAFASLLLGSCGEKSAPGIRGGTAAAASPPPVPKLVIGMEAEYPPFEFVDDKGQITGVSVEIGREIATTLGREPEFRNIKFDGLITALKTGSIDLIISSMTATDERRQSIDFSDPYVKNGLAVLVSKNSRVQKADDLKTAGSRIVVRLGTTGETWARKELPQAKLVSLDSDPACVLEVINGSVDAWIYDQISIMNHHARHPDATRALLAPLREEVWAVGLTQGQPELKAKINQTLARFRAEGGFTRLADKYLGKERDAMKAQGLPFVFELGK